MWEDPIVADVRRIQEELAAEHEFDVHAIFAEMRRWQIRVGARLIAPGRAEAAPPDRDFAALHPGR